jgi:hypothetical protein
MGPVVLEFDNRLTDHLAAERLYHRSTFWFKADKMVAILLFIFGVFAVSVAGIRWWTVVWFPLAVIEWFNLLSFRPLQIRFFFKRNPKFLEKYHLTFSDSGIDFKTRSLESKLAWTHYTHVLEDDRVILLIYGTRMYTVIPTRAFADAKQHDRSGCLSANMCPGALPLASNPAFQRALRDKAAPLISEQTRDRPYV